MPIPEMNGHGKRNGADQERCKRVLSDVIMSLAFLKCAYHAIVALFSRKPVFIMKLHRLQILELLDVQPGLGTIHMQDQRMVLQSTSALGLLRKEMIDAFGVEEVRRLAYRTGYATGYQAGKTLARHFGSSSVLEDIEIGCTMHTIGLGVLVEPISEALGSDGSVTLEVICRNSYEASEYLQHFPAKQFPVCWSMTGIASGYLSAVMEKEVYAREIMCVGKGDPCCKLVIHDATQKISTLYIRSAFDWRNVARCSTDALTNGFS
jgi:predicted hydrocarbon binding protein